MVSLNWLYSMQRRLSEYTYMTATLPHTIQRIILIDHCSLKDLKKIYKWHTIRTDWRTVEVFLENFQGQKTYFIFALEQTQKALKYFHRKIFQLKPLFPAQKGQVPISPHSERPVLPEEN